MAGNRRPEGKSALQVWIDDETHMKFKMLCTMRKLKMTQITEELINEYVARETDKISWMQKAIRDSKK